jgi:hypothetical protein
VPRLPAVCYNGRLPQTRDEERLRLHVLLDVILEHGSAQAIEAIRLDLEMVGWTVEKAAERELELGACGGSS